MKGKLTKLEWIPGYNMSSSRGYKKNTIKKAMKNADYVKNNGYGNYSVIKYSEYFGTFELEDGTTKTFDIRKQLKEHFNINRFTESERNKIEDILPIVVDVNEYQVTFM